MKTLQFTKKIHAPVQKVWDVLWNDDTYLQWTAPLTPGVGVAPKTDWKKGSEILFQDGEGNGIASIIKDKNEPYLMEFEHQGEIHGGKIATGEPGNSWTGALESYSLSESGGTTTLKATVEVDDSFEDLFTDGFIKGFEIVKQLAEKD